MGWRPRVAAVVVIAVAVATAPPEQSAQHLSVRLAQLSREVQRQKTNYNYHEDPPPGTKHAPFKDALLTRCSLRIFRSRTLYTKYCPKASPAEFARLGDMLRRMRDNCNTMRSARQIESRLRAVIGHPSLGENATCVRELMAHNSRIAQASVESLARLEALYRTEYPNQHVRNRSSRPAQPQSQSLPQKASWQRNK